MPITDYNGEPIHLANYHPNRKLAEVIVEAWKDRSYKEKLLTFDEPYVGGQTPTAGQYGCTHDALARFDIHIGKPVVLTLVQYAVGYQKAPGDVVFVLPDPLDQYGADSHDAEIAMAITPCGM